MREEPTVYVITGPTASGKSALAVELARKIETDIISADSRQIYKGIPIVTAVPDENERGGVCHHLIECISLESYYSASLFECDSLSLIDGLLREKKSAIVCGGSMLYIDALCNGIDDLPTVPEDFRSSLMKEWRERGDDWLLSMLKSLDPAYWLKVDQRNLKRVFHAVEITLTSGTPYSELIKGEKIKRPFKIIKICLEGNREKLFERINRRVEEMMRKGLEEEALKVYPKRHLNSLNTVGLKEMFAMFDGVLTRDEAIKRIQKNTRVYAKKQETWHRRDLNMIRLDFEDGNKKNIEKILYSEI